MKQLVILSGKGGTGKTSLAACFAHLASQALGPDRLVMADADVDAANLEFLVRPQRLGQEEFVGGNCATIDQAACSACGECAAVCRFDAILAGKQAYHVDTFACEGCAACAYRCPTGAIRMVPQVAGAWFSSASRFGPLFHAHLLPGQENSGKLVTLVKQHARLKALDEGRDLVIVDGPPGIGCPVISSISGADLALIVTEPTQAGAHDLERILATARHFQVPALVCVNKCDLYPQGTEDIEGFCARQGIEVIGHIPFDPSVTEALVAGEPVTAFRPQAAASQAIASIWEGTCQAVLEGECQTVT